MCRKDVNVNVKGVVRERVCLYMTEIFVGVVEEKVGEG